MNMREHFWNSWKRTKKKKSNEMPLHFTQMEPEEIYKKALLEGLQKGYWEGCIHAMEFLRDQSKSKS